MFSSSMEVEEDENGEFFVASNSGTTIATTTMTTTTTTRTVAGAVSSSISTQRQRQRQQQNQQQSLNDGDKTTAFGGDYGCGEDENTAAFSTSLSSSSSSLNICMNGQVIYQVLNRHELATRSEYFASLESWPGALELFQENDDDNDNDNNDNHDNKLVRVNVPPEIVAAFLKALEGNAAEHGFLQSIPAIPPIYCYYLWSYFSCTNHELWQNYLKHLSVSQRVELVQQAAAAAGGLDLANNLVLVEGFWDDMTRHRIPLDRNCCTSLPVALRLLQAFDEAKADHYHYSCWPGVGAVQETLQTVTGGGINEKKNNQRLTPSEFAILTLQKFASSSTDLWSDVTQFQLILSHLPKKHQPPKDQQHEKYTAGLEAWMSLAMTQHNLEMPPVLKQWPGLNVANGIAQALFQTERLEEALSYPSPKLILQTISDQWTTHECAAAIEQDLGGLGRLLDRLDTTTPQKYGCSWLTQIPVFLHARNVAQGLVKVALFRIMFLHVPTFDPTLPPDLLGTLPLEIDAVAIKSLYDATLYLEHGMDSPTFVKLPWKVHGTRPLLGRVVRALDRLDGNRGEQSLLWKQNCIDLDRVPDADLPTVPARILATHAIRSNRQTHATVVELVDRVVQLETILVTLQAVVCKLEQQLQQAQKNQAKRQRLQTKKQQQAKENANKASPSSLLSSSSSSLEEKKSTTTTTTTTDSAEG